MNTLAAREIAGQRTAAKFPFLIKITHPDPDFPDMLYANSSENISYDGDIYNAATFSIKPPDRDTSKIGDASLTISAVDQVWPSKIRRTMTPAKIQFMAVIIYENNTMTGIEAMEDNCFTLRAANWNETSITWQMIFDENMGIQIPADNCNSLLFPGCA